MFGSNKKITIDIDYLINRKFNDNILYSTSKNSQNYKNNFYIFPTNLSTKNNIVVNSHINRFSPEKYHLIPKNGINEKNQKNNSTRKQEFNFLKDSNKKIFNSVDLGQQKKESCSNSAKK